MDRREGANKSSIFNKLVVKPVLELMLGLLLHLQGCSQLLLLLEEQLVIDLFIAHLNLLLLEIANQRFPQPVTGHFVNLLGVFH